MKLEWKCNQPEQIKQGVEPAETVTVEVNLADLSLEQRTLLAAGWKTLLVLGTPEEVSELLTAEVSKRAEAEEEYREKCLTATIVEDTPGKHWDTGVEITWERCKIEPYAVSYSPNHFGDPRVRTWGEVIAPLVAEVARRNGEAKSAAIEAAVPLIEAAKDKLKSDAEEAKQKNAEALKVLLARRVETETVEVKISRGDSREWGTPWGAIVAVHSGKNSYDFSASEYDLATEVLTIKCQQGEVIAWGQKNFRKPRKSTHERRKVNTDWMLEKF